MGKKIIIFSAILIITIFGLFFSEKNLAFAVCTNGATECSKTPGIGYCSDPCHEDPPGSGNYTGLNNPVGRVCMCNPLTSDTLEDLIAKVISFIFMVATVIFPLMVVLAAFLYTTSAGNPSNIERAKNILIYSSVGYGMVILAHALVYVIKNVIGAI
jgi:hypothetical protein